MSDSVCILPRAEGVGGPASFRMRLSAGLEARGIRVHQNPDDPTCRAVLVLGGTRNVTGLWRARRRGVRIVQRLNGMNWIQRLRRTGARHFLRAEMNNLVLAGIRRGLAHEIVYQSDFCQAWWERVYGKLRTPARVIYNGVDLNEFSPQGPERPPTDRARVLVVEGHLDRAHETELESILGLARRLRKLPAEVWVAGDVPQSYIERYEVSDPGLVKWLGVVGREQVPGLARASHMLFAVEIHAACPNSVIEGLACGLPVLAFDTGSMAEMVPPSAGRVTPWGGDDWKLDPPDLDGLARAAEDILARQAELRAGARARAEALFGLESMVEAYRRVLGV
ncbi:MAG: glycosyltransferase family 4 protein [Anaerolineaceae bacterium]|nr:glycosyltransferase family 4 protein [Anaerolineaceae bacterium]